MFPYIKRIKPERALLPWCGGSIKRAPDLLSAGHLKRSGNTKEMLKKKKIIYCNTVSVRASKYCFGDLLLLFIYCSTLGSLVSFLNLSSSLLPKRWRWDHKCPVVMTESIKVVLSRKSTKWLLVLALLTYHLTPNDRMFAVSTFYQPLKANR